MSSSQLILALLCLLGVAFARVAARRDDATTDPPTLKEVAEYLRLGADDQRKLLDGQIVSYALEETTDRELAISVAMLDKRPLAEVVKTVHDLRDLTASTGFHVLGDPPDDAGFSEAGFTPGEAGEAGDLLRAKPGSAFNLSSEEFKELASLAKTLGSGAEKTPTGLSAINEQYRRILQDRYAAYRAKGLSGMACYDRGDGKPIGPQEDLFAASASAGKFLNKFFPRLYESMSDYPGYQEQDLEHQFFWVKQPVENRATFMLSHRAYLRTSDVAVIVERQFYVGHSYNAMQIVVGCVPHESGTLVFYTNRTATDRVSGLGSGLAHAIGRGRMRDRVVELFKRLRESEKKR